jgi:RNA polymerase sigma-32 factor
MTKEKSFALFDEDVKEYIQQIKKYPFLTFEEEMAYGRAYLETGDRFAAEKLVLSNLRFVVSISIKYRNYGLALQDLIQEGNIGLMQAVKRFDYRRGVRLTTFAAYWIRAQIHEFVIKNWQIVKMATTKAQRKLFFRLRQEKKSSQWLTEEEIEIIAQKLKVKKNNVREMEKRMTVRDTPFDSFNDDEEENTFPEYSLSESIDPLEYLIKEEENPKNQLREAIKLLDDKSKDILLRRKLCDEKSVVDLKTLANEYGVSAERIRQIEEEAILKLKKILKKE